MTASGVRWWRRLAIAGGIVLVIAALVYGGLCALFAVQEPSLAFNAVKRVSVSPATVGYKGVEEVTVTTEDGERLYGWWAPPPAGHGALLYFVGKNLVLSDEEAVFGDLVQQGFGVLSIDYRGDGKSTGQPSEAGYRSDARAAFDFVRAHAPDAKIVPFGESLGTWPAVAVAHDRPVAGVLLNSPFASLVRLFELGEKLPLPYRWLMADPLDSEALIGALHVPVMILHGTADRNVPIAEARRLFAAANQPKEMIEVAGAGHGQVWFGPTRDKALAALRAWTAGPR